MASTVSRSESHSGTLGDMETEFGETCGRAGGIDVLEACLKAV